MSKRLRLDVTGLRIAKPGKSATSTNLADLLVGPGILNTRAKLQGLITGAAPKVSQSSISGGYQATYAVSIVHGLGYIPIYSFSVPAGDFFPAVVVDSSALTYSESRFYAGQPPATQVFAQPLAYLIFFDRWV